MNGLITMLGTLLHLILGLNLVSADGESNSHSSAPPPPPPVAGCGGIEQPCCDGDFACEDGSVCQPAFSGAQCEACGGVVPGPGDFFFGQTACDDGYPCEEGLQVSGCGANGAPGVCNTCGDEYEECCVSGIACNGNLVCQEDVFFRFEAKRGPMRCLDCGKPGKQICTGSDKEPCEDGTVVTLDNRTRGGPNALYCEPPLDCGSDENAPCCTEGPACPASVPLGFGPNQPEFVPLTCVAGTCVTCGAKGFIPCENGCEMGLEVVRGTCRGPNEPLCGLLGEPCCADAGDLRALEFCEDGTSCSSNFFMDPPAPDTCISCGGLGENPCIVRDEARNLRRVCEEDLTDDYETMSPPVRKCVEEPGIAEDCGQLDFPACPDYLNDDYSSQFCPCGPGLIEKDGMCVVAPARPSAPTVTPSTALMDTPMNGPDVPNEHNAVDASESMGGYGNAA